MKYIWGWGFIREMKKQRVNRIDKKMTEIMNHGLHLNRERYKTKSRIVWDNVDESREDRSL